MPSFTVRSSETPRRVFLLSPANCNGRRAQQALSPNAQFDVAVRLRSLDGVPLGELFAFVSGLYFRGKLAYARRFAAPPEHDNPIVGSGIHIITPNAGLRSPDTLVTADAIRAFSQASVDVGERDLSASVRAECTRAPQRDWRLRSSAPREHRLAQVRGNPARRVRRVPSGFPLTSSDAET